MWSFTKDLLYRGWQEALANGSSTGISVLWLGFGALVLGFVFTVVIEWLTGGLNMAALITALKSWKSWAGAGIALFVVWACLFVCSTLNVAYHDHQQLVAAEAKTCPQIVQERPKVSSNTVVPHFKQESRVNTQIPQNGSGNTASPVTITGIVKQGGNGDCQANALGGNAIVENSCNGRMPPPSRVIPSEHYKEIRDYLAVTPSTVIVSVNGGKESYDFAHALYNLLKDAGWKMKDGDVRATTPTGPPWEGTTVKFHGTPLSAGQQEQIAGNKPEDHLGQVLGALKTKPNADRRETYPEGLIEVEIGDQPMQPAVKRQ